MFATSQLEQALIGRRLLLVQIGGLQPPKSTRLTFVVEVV